MITIGIDIGGTSMKAALTEPGGAVLAKTRRPTLADNSRDATIEQLHSCIEELTAKAAESGHTVDGIGIGVPGTIDLERGVVYHPPNLPQWDEVPLADIMRSRWPVDVRIDNDANCAALGEAHFGAGRDYDNFIGLTLGTGVGSGIILANRIYHGERGFAGEFGHITIDYNGPRCNCGNLGCVEAYIGIRYMMRDAIPILQNESSSPLHQRARNNPESLSPEDLSRAASDGDAVSAGVLRTAGERLGVAIASAANLLDITTFIIGGGISAAGDVLFDGIRGSATSRALRVHRARLTILPASLGNDAGMLGAASLLL
ncbi:MAG: ROK family protein [Bacteroidetes bacterium]|nr:ROK family protein [Bacteroidota bacterium]